MTLSVRMPPISGVLVNTGSSKAPPHGPRAQRQNAARGERVSATTSRRPPSAGSIARLLDARRVIFDRLEGVEGDVLALARLPMLVGAVGLADEVPVVDALHFEHLIEALVDEHVLAPKARPGTEVVEVPLALLDPVVPSCNRPARQHLQRAMQAELAVVQVEAVVVVGVEGDDDPQPLREEGRVGVGLHRPGIVAPPPLLHDLSPHRDENVRVQRGAELAAHVAVKIALHRGTHQSRAKAHGHVADNLILVAAEYAPALLELHLKQPALVAEGLHQGVAEEGIWSVPSERHPRDDALLGCLCDLPDGRVDASKLAGPVPRLPHPEAASGILLALGATTRRLVYALRRPDVPAGVLHAVVDAAAVRVVRGADGALDRDEIGPGGRDAAGHTDGRARAAEHQGGDAGEDEEEPRPGKAAEDARRRRDEI
eukprot:CAMPEP_0176211026 /NCGR_PEP_ID=MMETSP0121_2-20121125/14443_1 /TAXON_ID=160619 /ORGANISM="Kryptoperidinium foliaceum, Strain CCMP 1326" /LENGTH=427 /DNA_ID=CAMNT_0017550069 /DNA_START=21 /DNA_END=1301 /DNA_ORIENTATION=-